MLAHSCLTLDSSPADYSIFEVMAEEESEILYINKVVQLFQRKRVKIGVDCLERETPQLTIFPNDVDGLCNVFHCQLYVFGIQQTTEEKD